MSRTTNAKRNSVVLDAPRDILLAWPERALHCLHSLSRLAASIARSLHLRAFVSVALSYDNARRRDSPGLY